MLGAGLLLGLIAPGLPAAEGANRAPRPELGTSAAFAPDGTLLVAAKQGEHVMLYRSRDEGRSWSAPVPVNAQPEPIAAHGENRPKIAFAADGGLLVSWTRPLGPPHSGAVRLARADDGVHFAPPLTVHRDPAELTHSFDSLLALPDNRVLVAWIDKRDLEAAKASATAYRGAAIYTALSTDGGRSFPPERKLADHACECCRIGSALDADGTPLVLWRHIFAPNERDHALARLGADGTAEKVQRATFDRWQLDACPHQGPSLAVAADGIRHAVWFNQRDGQGRVHYGRLSAAVDSRTEPQGEGRVAGQRTVGGPRAAHADLAVTGGRLGIAWKEFDGERTQLHALVSGDGGRSFTEKTLAATDGASDQPRVIQGQGRLYAFWRTEKEGFRLLPLP